MHRSRRLVPVRVRATWYAYLALAVAGMLTDATTWAVVVVAVGCAAIPLALVAAPACTSCCLASGRDSVPAYLHQPQGTKMMSMTDGRPEPIRGDMGTVMTAPRNIELERQNPDLLVPPLTDSRLIGEPEVLVLDGPHAGREGRLDA
jgi:hypothetical protein